MSRHPVRLEFDGVSIASALSGTDDQRIRDRSPMSAAADALACVKGKRIALISHDLSRTGSPLLLIETAVSLRAAGATVGLVTLADDSKKSDLAARHRIPVIPSATSFAHCAEVDLIIANTAETQSWVDHYLERYPGGGGSLIWWIHELDAASYAGSMGSLHRIAMALFDSSASLRSWAATGLVCPPVARVLHPCVDQGFMERASGPSFPDPRRGFLERMGLRAARLHTRETIRQQLGVEPGDFLVTLIGTYHRAKDRRPKGHDLLARTVGRMVRTQPDLPIKLLLVGFRTRSARRSLLAALDDAALKALDPRRAVSVVPDLAPYYAASDAFVMNSQGLGENFGRVTIEAMAFGLPVLGTRAGGTPEIIEDGVTGLLHPVGVVGQDSLAENLLTLLADRDLARVMGEAGHRRVQERFSSPRFYGELGALLTPILAVRNGTT